MASPDVNPEEESATAVSADQQAPGVDIASSSHEHGSDKEVNESADVKDAADATPSEPQRSAEEEEQSQDIPTSAPASVYSTGLIVDSGSDYTETDNDDDSAYGTSVYSTTQSVRSSIYDYVEENGRTYHRFKEGKYFLPNDEVSPLEPTSSLCSRAM